MKIIEIIIITIISSGIISGIIVYFGKTFLGQFLAKELERYKSGLQSELELFKSDLNKDFHTFSTQFSQVYQRRVTGVLAIHDQLCEIDKLVIWESGGIDTALINTSPEDCATQALNKAWEEVGSKLDRILNYHSLLLDATIYEYVHRWAKVMMELIAKTGTDIESIRQSGVNISRPLPERQELVKQIRDKYLNHYIPQLAPIRRVLELEFRKILGLSTDNY